jgi:hypothetical protein
MGYRRTENFRDCRAVVADVDLYKQGCPSTIEEGLSVIRSICALSPPSVIIGSGGGLHLYWLLRDPLPYEEWLARARGLSALLNQRGLRHDTQCTANPVGVLRLPGTSNWKTGTARPVTLVEANFIPPEHKAGNLLRDPIAIPAWTKAAAGSSRAAGYGMPFAQDSRWPPADGATVAMQCGQIAKSLGESGANDDEPLWRAMLSMAAQFEDPTEWAHRLSRGHPDYSAAETDAKLARTWLPYKCERFNEMRPGICPACVHFRQIATPLQLDHNRRGAP